MNFLDLVTLVLISCVLLTVGLFYAEYKEKSSTTLEAPQSVPVPVLEELYADFTSAYKERCTAPLRAYTESSQFMVVSIPPKVKWEIKDLYIEISQMKKLRGLSSEKITLDAYIEENPTEIVIEGKISKLSKKSVRGEKTLFGYCDWELSEFKVCRIPAISLTPEGREFLREQLLDYEH